MFKLIQSPIQRPLNNVVFNGCHIPRPTYPRYSSVEDFNSRQDPNVSLLRFDLKPQKRGTTMQKTDRSEKQRSHSQKKLTLITAQPQNTSYNSSLSTSQNINFGSPRQAYEGYKKSSQLKTLNSSRNAPLQKRSKPTTTKYNYQQRFPTSTCNIRNEGDAVSQQQNQNDDDIPLSFVKFQKQKSNRISELDETNNLTPMSTQNYISPRIQTVPPSPVYEPSLRKENSSHSNQTINNTSILQYCQDKITQLTHHTQSILIENSKKIKELESLLTLNKQKLEEKDQIIRQLELNAVLRETSKPQHYSHFTQHHLDSPGHFRGNSMDFRINQYTFKKNQEEYLDSRVNDLEKKIQVISQWFQTQQQKINEKIDKMNNFMERFVAVKFHNMKVTLKTFVTKNQQKVNFIIDAIKRVEDIVKLNLIDEYEKIVLKTKQFASTIQKFSDIKVSQKVQFDDMKTTMNTTAIEICKLRPTLQDYQNMVESREINESFWNNFEDFSQSKNSEQSFTDDSFSYAPGIDNNPNTSPSSNSNSSVNDFPVVKQFPSFSRKINNNLFQAKRFPFSQPQWGCIKTIEQISRCRHGPLSVYLDPSGNMRYRSSQSYVFDRRGNILKPTLQQINYCLKMSWITLN